MYVCNKKIPSAQGILEMVYSQVGQGLMKKWLQRQNVQNFSHTTFYVFYIFVYLRRF